MRRGFSLVEVIVALVVLQVGILGTATLALRAQELMRAAEESERTDWALRTLADSLGRVAEVTGGARRFGQVELRWTPAPGVIVVEVVGRSGPGTLVRLPALAGAEP